VSTRREDAVFASPAMAWWDVSADGHARFRRDSAQEGLSNA